MSFSPEDERFMLRALEIARRGVMGAHPNPMVGAVVARSGRIVGEGAHLRFGGPHAEINAIRDAGAAARGATLYVTLEPCSSCGKTPPCSEAIIKAGIRGVVFGARDPNPANCGRAARVLRAAGIKTRAGLLAKRCGALNPGFNKLMREGLPYVTAKIAQSLDGRVADRLGNSRWITGAESRRFVHRLRAESDAVITGIGTVLSDNPMLNARLPGARQPLRVVADTELRIPVSCDMVKTAREHPLLVACSSDAPAAKRRALEKAGCGVLAFKTGGRVPLAPLMRELGRRGIAYAMLESGPALCGAFSDAGLVDKFIFISAPAVFGGGKALPSLGGRGIARVSGGLLGLRLENVSVRMCGGDIVAEGHVHRNN
ncbi:MAG: bifunctional diaminohydroxyphosphoribosylaminopyrimidine deaminase/5-amino-6-(5-phosphoribosylamino)uracil reductase RibD [Elusimicrobiales bacterium]